MKKKLPPNCSISNYKYGYVVFRPRAKKGDTFPTDKQGRLKPPIRIGKISDSAHELYKNYLAAVESIQPESVARQNSLYWINEKYLKSKRYKDKAKSTKKRDKYSQRILDHQIVLNGEKMKLGSMLASQITKPKIRAIADKRLADCKAKGQKGETKINHEIRYLSAMFTWSMEFIENIGIQSNPCKGIRKFTENKNTRYVTDEDYITQYTMAPDVLKVFFEITYLCAARTIEVRDIRLSDVQDDGILIKRRKGSKTNIVNWNHRLKAAVKIAMTIRKKYCNGIAAIDKKEHLLVNTTGDGWRESAINSAMGSLKKKMIEQGKGGVFWSLHKLKSKGSSDSEDERLTGHKSEAMRQLYKTKIEHVEPPKS